jgi:phosphoglycolate phosphatase-like HAD superfamily hydrolase
MKNLFSIIAVAGMTAIVACGPSAAEKAEKAKQDSIHVADSLSKMQMAAKAKADSAAAVEAKKAEMDKMKAEEAAKAAHEDSIAKKLIKAPKKEESKKHKK